MGKDGVIKPGTVLAAIRIAIRDNVVDGLGVCVTVILLRATRATGVMNP
jgi:hypothetical protein